MKTAVVCYNTWVRMSSWPTICCSVLDSWGDKEVGSMGVVCGTGSDGGGGWCELCWCVWCERWNNWGPMLVTVGGAVIVSHGARPASNWGQTDKEERGEQKKEAGERQEVKANEGRKTQDHIMYHVNVYIPTCVVGWVRVWWCEGGWSCEWWVCDEADLFLCPLRISPLSRESKFVLHTST